MLLTTDELAQMRSDINALTLPDTCNILTATSTSDGQGGYDIAWGTAYENVACRMDIIKGGEVLVADSLQPSYSYILTVAQSATIDEQARVEYGGNTYNVLEVKDGSWQLSKRVRLERTHV
jgi:hypothetical protein